MPSRFLTAPMPDGSLRWACIDAASLCTAPAVADRRLTAYVAPFTDEPAARQALLDAGADPETINAEPRTRRHAVR